MGGEGENKKRKISISQLSANQLVREVFLSPSFSANQFLQLYLRKIVGKSHHILPSGAYITLYLHCSHYEMRGKKRHLSCGFPQAIHVTVKIPRSCCVDNCSNNGQSQPNLNFYILPSDKQRRRAELAASNQSGIAASKFLHSLLLVDQLYARKVYFCKFVTKLNQACINIQQNVFNSFYWTVTHGESHKTIYK